MHALIIEDEPLIAMNIEDALRECGCLSFDFATNADAAVAAASRRAPDLITADVRLNPGCGIDAVETIWESGRVPVIFITGTPAEVRDRLPDHAILHKPFSSSELARVVELVTSPLRDSA